MRYIIIVVLIFITKKLLAFYYYLIKLNFLWNAYNVKKLSPIEYAVTQDIDN